MTSARPKSPLVVASACAYCGLSALIRAVARQPAAGADALLSGLDEQGADAARLQRLMDGELPQRPGARGQRVIDPAERHGQARRGAGGEIVHFAALRPLKCLDELGTVPG
jgi:hypothetical protein